VSQAQSDVGHCQARPVGAQRPFRDWLLESKVNFMCCGNPHAKKVTIQMTGIADELTRQKWPTARGAESWSMMAVSNILKRTRSN
jgi:hypothetical protein